ncbi:hypothetical protein [Beggiatoa leptomitoformis]|uniref:Uncharacterized protein n=1 Tax=Beggiatoa leptomitoformis TaxID=288004 RepID=A0A2N9YE62_9GAMM|nr:hypothetical protein [Beggiatoa leptomitoformis]ALG68891.1 hypothetical protein AL038_15795 [Beggiatoa leptomitoformis]AUI68736.1 hypothetical protein BLE401_08465 [Beggiatoa leptomitoformis]
MTVQKTADYGTPTHFFLVMLVFAYSSYHIESLMGLWPVIFITIWALITLLTVVSLKKQALPYDHPKVLFFFLISFTIVGAFIGSILNAESFILLLIWYFITLITLNWLQKNPKADKRLYYLISIQFIALGLGISNFLHYSNLDLQTICAPVMTAMHAQHHSDTSHEAMMSKHEDKQPALSAETTKMETASQESAHNTTETEHVAVHEATPTAEHAKHEASASNEPVYDKVKATQAWLTAFQYIILFISFLISWRAFRLARCTA